MVVGDADGPLLERELDDLRAHATVRTERLLLAAAAEHKRARKCGVGQEVVHRPTARPRPADAPRTDRAPREPLAFCDQFGRHLACGAERAPEPEHPLDRVAHLVIRREHDPPVPIALEPERQIQRELAPLGLVAQAAVQPGADQVQLGLRHRALQTRAAADR
jgi:hypothetical protein